MATDIENQLDNEDLGPVEANEPLLPKPPHDRSSNKSSRRSRNRRSLEVIELDDIPPIIKSANGNIFWADEQCTRRVGLTSTEARLFLKLLQTDEPENYNYQDYKEMFDDFGAEQARLKELVKGLPWYKLDTYRQRGIWKARIEWLERMKEPRLWLLYLMARRRRILQQASVRVLARLTEKRRWKLENGGHYERGRQPPAPKPMSREHEEIPALAQIMLSEATQTSTPKETSPLPPPSRANQLSSEATQTSTSKETSPLPPSRGRNQAVPKDPAPSSEHRLSQFTSRLRDSLSASRHRHSPRSSQGQCPIFEKPFEATREDIKRQVESIMPKTKPYIVVGWFHRSAGDPKERILQFERPEQLFRAMRKGEYQVRGYREYISLKSLRGFGLYKCDISRGAHIPLILNSSQEGVLAQLFFAYKASYRHADDDVTRAWYGWVAKNLNDGKENPLEGRYSLQLLYDWSSYRLSTVVAIPVILSLAIGTWYMMGQGDVVTAWTLALYIVTTAAALIALMAIIGSLKDI
ncbi:hypothetical protein V8E51_005880 [Hyaloscypha variabilis]